MEGVCHTGEVSTRLDILADAEVSRAFLEEGVLYMSAQENLSDVVFWN